MSQNIMVPKSGVFYPIGLVQLAFSSHDRQSTAAMPAGKAEQAVRAVRECMVELGVSGWWRYRLKIIDPWRPGYALNFDPNNLHVQVHLKLSKAAVKKLGRNAADLLRI